MKISWICHFTDPEIQSILKPSHPVNEYGLWISMLIKAFENHPEIELNIISPHKFISGARKFDRNGIHYFFFNAFMPFIGRQWPSFFRWDIFADYRSNKRKIASIIDSIKPDIIHLHGFENAYYSSSIFQFKRSYPVFITVQGFVSNFQEIKGKAVKKRFEVEQRILAEFQDFGIRTKTMGDDVIKYNPSARLHWHRYNILINERAMVSKKYDIVFFARVSEGKGIEDLLEALGQIKRDHAEDYSLEVIGSVNEQYLRKLQEMSTKLDIAPNVSWLGFQESQEDVHDLAAQARICVLPTKNDIIPGTIVESMALGIPVISYDVGSIKEINDDDEYIVLLDVNDVEGLAREIHRVLGDAGLQKDMARKAKTRVNRLLDNDSVYPDLIKAYKTTIENFGKEKSV